MGFKLRWLSFVWKTGVPKRALLGVQKGVFWPPPGPPKTRVSGPPHRAEIQGFYKPGATTVEAHVAKRLLGMGGGGRGD